MLTSVIRKVVLSLLIEFVKKLTHCVSVYVRVWEGSVKGVVFFSKKNREHRQVVVIKILTKKKSEQHLFQAFVL